MQVALAYLRRQGQRRRHHPHNPVQRTATAQLAQRGILLTVGLGEQTAAVNQNGTLALQPALLSQAWHQLFDCCLVAGNQQQADFAPPEEGVAFAQRGANVSGERQAPFPDLLFGFICL